MWSMTWLSLRPVTLRISSKVMRSAQAAQIIQSGLIRGLPEDFEKMECYRLLQGREVEVEAVSGVSKGTGFVEGSNSRESGKVTSGGGASAIGNGKVIGGA
mgnify:CR=1 FL=1|jgi:hypothetical protein